MSSKSPTSDRLVPRLCHIVKWDHFDGYGFNLHAEKGVPGQYIGKVDQGSPAEATGLKQGDRIVEVNGVNITTESHKAVVQRIKAVPNETKLLVVDAATDKCYKSKNVIIKGILPEILYLKTPCEKDNGNEDVPDNHSQASEGSAATGEMEVEAQKSVKNDRPSSAAASEKEGSIDSNPESSEEQSAVSSLPGSGDSTMKRNEQNVTLNLNMSAKDYQNYLKAKKKYDPKKESMDTRKKYEIIQKL